MTILRGIVAGLQQGTGLGGAQRRSDRGRRGGHDDVRAALDQVRRQHGQSVGVPVGKAILEHDMNRAWRPSCHFASGRFEGGANGVQERLDGKRLLQHRHAST